VLLVVSEAASGLIVPVFKKVPPADASSAHMGPGHPLPVFPTLVHSLAYLLLFFYFSHFPFLIRFTYFLLWSIPSPFLPE